MLVLTRKTTEAIVIDNDTEVTVLRVESNRAWLQIKGAKEVTVLKLPIQHRHELAEPTAKLRVKKTEEHTNRQEN